MFDGLTRTCGLIGNPVEHTLSPLIQNTLAERTDVNLVYVPFFVEKGRLQQAVEGAYALNLLGVNVTVPYKNDCMEFLKDIDPLAKKIGAVNTLVRIEGGYKGYNTDMPGLYRAMTSDGIVLEGKKVVIIGAGGVARAVGVMLAEKDVESIWVANRTLEKAQMIVEELNSLCGKEIAKAIALEHISEIPGENYIAIQATNVGMYPKNEEIPVSDKKFYDKVEIGYDLIYNPEVTCFMKTLLDMGKKAYNGSKMLLYQGIIAYELWTGKSVTESTADEIYQMMMDKLREGSKK